MKLVAVAKDADPAALALDLAPGFGGDEAPARELLEQTLALLASDPRPDPWGCYLAEHEGTIIGTCAFKSAPDEHCEVEFAYMTFPAFEGQGHATAMAGLLASIAEEGGAMPIAHTLPEENASGKALRRNNFVHVSEVIDPEDGLVWRWERRR